MAKTKKHLGEILYKAGVVEKQAMVAAIKESKTNGRRLGEILLDKGLVNEDTLYKALAKQAGIKYVSVEKVPVPSNMTRILPEDLIRKFNVLPLKLDGGRLKIIVSDPNDLDMMDSVRLRVNAELDCYLSSPSKIRDTIEQRLSSPPDPIEEESMAPEPEPEPAEKDELSHSIDLMHQELQAYGNDIQAEIYKASAGGGDEGPIVRLGNLIIDNAYHMRASDIHIECMGDRVRIRYRVDGVCMEKDVIPKNMQAPVDYPFQNSLGDGHCRKAYPAGRSYQAKHRRHGHRFPCLGPTQ